MRHRILDYILPISALVLFACQLSTATPVPTSPPLVTPQAGSVQIQAPPQITLPDLPATPTLGPNTLVDDGSGVRLDYPDGWSHTSGNGSDGPIFDLTSPDGRALSRLYYFPANSGDTPESLALDLQDQLTGEVQVTNTSENGPITLNNGQPAWTLVFDSQHNTNNQTLTINITAAIHGPRSFLLLSFSDPDGYKLYQKDIQAMALSLDFQSPSLMGIPSNQALVLSGGESTNPREYDPATTHGSGDKLVFSGLVSFDPNLNLIPELAGSWDVSPDNTVYTFHLRQNAKFHDGRPVTAQDVVYSWERAAAPQTESDTVMTYLDDIVGVKEMHQGKAEHISGLNILDDHTLQVTIDAPKPYFLLKLTYPTAFVVDKADVESGPDWYRTPNGTGPYKLVKWEKFQAMVYQRNPDFYLGPPAIPYVIVQLYSGVGIRLYEAGEIDMAGISSYAVARVQDPKDPLHTDLYSGVSLCTSFVYFDTTRPPFDDVKVRQAFSMAFDRQKYIDVVLNGSALPADGLYPPALPGFNPNLKGLAYDPVQARELLKQSKYGGTGNLPPIVYTDAGIGNDAHPSVAAMAQLWEQNLGVKITIENIEPDRYLDEIYAGHHGQMFDGGWCADYPDPQNFADVLFHSGAPQNNGGYSNPNLDALLEQARVEQDVQKRLTLYQQAEQIIVDAAPVLFTTHALSYMLVKPYVKGFVLTPIDIPLERYMWLENK